MNDEDIILPVKYIEKLQQENKELHNKIDKVIDYLIPTKEEMEQTIRHIIETREISSHDEIVLWKMKLIKYIVNSKKTRI